MFGDRKLRTVTKSGLRCPTCGKVTIHPEYTFFAKSSGLPEWLSNEDHSESDCMLYLLYSLRQEVQGMRQELSSLQSWIRFGKEFNPLTDNKSKNIEDSSL